MSTKTFLAVGVVGAAFALPFAAFADKPAGTPGKGPDKTSQTTSSTTTPSSTTPTAPGQYCKGLAKKHVAGQQGTPFSQCVVALQKINNGQTTSPAKACKGLSKKHVKGQKGTPFSRCVVAAAHLLGHKAHDESTTTPPSTVTPRSDTTPPSTTVPTTTGP
jgi:hypothetical protein